MYSINFSPINIPLSLRSFIINFFNISSEGSDIWTLGNSNSLDFKSLSRILVEIKLGPVVNKYLRLFSFL